MTQYTIMDRIGQLATDILSGGVVARVVLIVYAVIFVASVVVTIVMWPRDRDFPTGGEK